MVGPPIQRIRMLKRVSEDAPELVRAVTNPAWARGAEVLKRTERSGVLSGRACGRAVVVKSVRIEGLGKRLACVVGRSRLQREWRGRELLVRAGVRVVGFSALFDGRGVDGARVQSIVMEKIEGQTVLHALAGGTLGVREEHALAASVGSMTARIVEGMLFNGDHKASNVIVSRGSDGWDLALIDVADIAALHGHDASEMLAKLVIECLGVGTLPRRAVMMRALKAYLVGLHRPDAHREWRHIRSLIESHGDPAPKDNPLA